MVAPIQQTIHQKLDSLAAPDLTEFRQFFKRLHKLFPQQAAEACLLYISAHGHDAAARSMAYWLVGNATYISVLLDVESLPQEAAAKAVAVVKDLDPEFFLRFAKATANLASPPVILRALSLLPSLGDYSILIPWLRTLGQNGDVRVRSRATKLLCELRPNKGLIERQMQSTDARVRAGALEAGWQAKNDETRAILRAALTDPHHRVVGNALVGLYRMGETDVLNDMIELCAHKDHLFRAAMAWAMGFVKDPRAIPTLQELAQDPSHMVRKRALASLLAIESLKPVENGTDKDDKDTDQEVPQEVPEEAAAPPDLPEEQPPASEAPGFNLFMFR
jgi:HEAT repeat protein